MGGFLGSLFIYILGGLTFPFLLIAGVLTHAYLTFPIVDDTREHEQDSIRHPGDEDDVDQARRSLDEKFRRKESHEEGVAAGYFAVTREFVPSGVNGKPPERTTPVGSTTVSAASPSVYQSMYRSIFDRKATSSPLDNKGAGRTVKRASNVFYVVLRHAHLMLFDDDEQLEVRHVVSLAHHSVSIYSGGDETPEGELFIKRNAICLSRRVDMGDIAPDTTPSKPFYLFSENCSDKEDFYFALLRSQDNHPTPLQYELKDIITLVQKLHSSEEHLQTRWINAVIGRVFLALYKTPEVENFVRAKITKKISRVKTPTFLSKISLQKLDMGEAAPVITNPRLKDLTVDGELVVEADVRYAGNFRLEVAATARIDLGTRFKAREVTLLLAVVLKRIEGHAMIRIKPPPSNRIWLCFQTMPKIDMTIEPIVSSRQITYTLILRQIENRIKEVVAESLVFPNWDDSPFYQSDSKTWRGGIWKDGRGRTPSDLEDVAAQHGDVDEAEQLETENEEAIMALPQVEKSISQPLNMSSPSSTYSRKGTKSALNILQSKAAGSSTSIETRASAPPTPRAVRSGSFASASSPIVSTDITTADAIRSSTPPEHSHAMAAIAALSQSNSPINTPVGSPSRPTRDEKPGSQSSASSKESAHYEKEDQNNITSKPSVDVASSTNGSTPSSHPPSPASMSSASFKSEAPSSKSLRHDPRRENSTSSGQSLTSENKRLSLAAVTNAAASAKKWGLEAFQRRAEQRAEQQKINTEEAQRPLVMGRGQPLPPPGQPLPPPDKKTKTAPIPVPKRKIIPPPNMPPHLPQRPEESKSKEGLKSPQRHPIPPPNLPKRRRDTKDSIHSTQSTNSADDGLLVVAAPAVDSDNDHAPSYMPPWVDDVEETEETQEEMTSPAPPPEHELPRLPRRPLPRVLSSSPEDGHKLPSWVAAQEEEARARSNFIDEDNAVV